VFEQKFTSVLSSLTEEEKQIAKSLRQEKGLEKIKQMNESEFFVFQEIIMKNLKETNKLFETIFSDGFSKLGEIESFDYDDLYRYYYNQVKLLLKETPPTVEELKNILENYAVPFYSSWVHMAVKNKKSYIYFIGETVEEEKKIKEIITLHEELTRLLKNLNSENDWDIQPDFLTISQLDYIIKRFSVEKFPNFSDSEHKNLEEQFKKYYFQKEDFAIARELIKEKISACETRFNKLCSEVKGLPNICLKKNAHEYLVDCYLEMKQKLSEVLESIEISTDSDEYSKVFCLSQKDLEKKGKILHYFKDFDKKNRLNDYFVYLYMNTNLYYDNQLATLKTKFKNVLENYVSHPEFMDFEDLEKMLDFFPHLSRFESILLDSYKRKTAYSFLGTAISPEKKDIVNQKTLLQIYYRIQTIIKDCGCLNLEVDKTELDRAILYSGVLEKTKDIKDVNEDEILEVAFDPVKRKIKIYGN